MASRKSVRSSRAPRIEKQPQARPIPDDQHPDYVGGRIDDGAPAALTPVPDGPPLPPFPPHPPFPEIPPWPPFPLRPQPFPSIPWPPRICMAVSGKYNLAPLLPSPGSPFPPVSLISVVVRVDVDRYFPQNRISIEVSRRFPRANGHAIAEVTSDQCLGYNHRRVAARITYRDGDATLIPGDQVVFEATHGTGTGYSGYSLTLISAGVAVRTYDLAFRSQYFDPVEFEIDQVANAGATVTTYDTGSHPNRPADLPSETISFATVYQRAGFDVTLSPNTTIIPNADAGANGTWSNGEMHNAMVTYWSRFADRPQWGLWVLFAARHDIGRGLGGIMFDDIGPNHRQGTAIFTDSFIQDATAGDANPAAWRQRMVFWTAAHEMGHAFNLAHAWQKAMGVAQGAPGDPWIPLTNQPEARTFMNYPFIVSGGEVSFFSDFRFRFTDDELVFMRHAPRRFVQMGNSNWFVNHNFEAPGPEARPGRWTLRIRPNRTANAYTFLEPVAMELKLTNAAASEATADRHLLDDGRHISVLVQRQGGPTREWRPMVTQCQEEHGKTVKSGESLYATHTISASTEGWLIDEPGFYKVQAAVDVGGEIVVSNVLTLFVEASTSGAENTLAPDYFTEDVARALAFGGLPAKPAAMNTLRHVVARCPKSPAAVHASLALSSSLMRDYKVLDMDRNRARVAIRSQRADIGAAAKAQTATLIAAPDIAAETLGHIDYFGALDRLAEAMAGAGDGKGAKKVMQSSLAAMKKRSILNSVVQAAERALARMK